MFPWDSLIGAAAGLIDGFVYTDQERQADITARQAAEANRALADAQLRAAEAAAQAAAVQAQTMQKVAIIGAGVVGLGLIVWASKN